MNPDTLPAARFRAFVWSLGLAVLTATAQTTTPAKPADKTDAAEPAAEEKKEAADGTLDKAEATKLIKLETYTVLGSRIRRTETEGPSPVNLYDDDYIKATGALNLADFLKTLPQNYTGVPSGRASAPNELNPESGLYTENSSPQFSFVTGNFEMPLGQTGVSGVSLRGLGSGSTLVLVDGRRVTQSGAGNGSSGTRQGFVDLNTIPLGMVDHIEMITDGASALYGADAVAGVINIVLKKNWTGQELAGSFKGAQHGGGHERSASLTSGFSYGPLRGTVNINYYDRAALKASQRSFSKNQDHRSMVAGYDASGNPVMGRDRRLNWGYPAVIQARTGNLNGITDANGNPTRFAVVKPGVTGTPTLADFIGVGPGPTGGASGIQPGNTAAFDDLIPASERYGVSGNLYYAIKPKLEAYLKYYFSDTRSETNTQPGVTSAATSSGFGNFASVVPAANNPFGQDIAVGMMHPEFGSIWQKVHTKAHNATLGFTGGVGNTWIWDAGVNYQKQESNRLTRNFNGAAITAALNNADASLRLNPFIDYRVAGITQTAVYEQFAMYPNDDSSVESTVWNLDASGELFDIWAGPVSLAVGGTYSDLSSTNTATAYRAAVTPIKTVTSAEGSRTSYAGYGELSIPLVGKAHPLPFLRRFDVQLAARYEDQGDAGSTTVPKVGIAWVPVKSVLLRASYSEGYRAPSLSELQVANSNSNASLLDPRRGGVNTTGIVITRGSNPDIGPETSTTETYGLVYEPTFAKGLTLSVNYYRTVQENLIQELGGQTLVNNEALFADRITRADPDATDTALGQPGRLTNVNLIFENFGKVQNESLDFIADYRLPWEQLGTWRVGVNASHTLKSTREFQPGITLVDDNGDTYSAPEWNFTTSVFWNKDAWSASAMGYYMSGFNTNSGGNPWTNNNTIVTSLYPSMWRLDLNAGYEFRHGVWRGYGKGLRVRVGIGNVMDEEPPFADNMYGYNGSLHSQWVLGRSYELSFTLPF